MTSKHNTISYRSTLFICGRPCHVFSFTQSSGDIIFLWEHLVYSVMGHINIVCIVISVILYVIKSWVWISSPKLYTTPFKRWKYKDATLRQGIIMKSRGKQCLMRRYSWNAHARNSESAGRTRHFLILHLTCRKQFYAGGGFYSWGICYLFKYYLVRFDTLDFSVY